MNFSDIAFPLQSLTTKAAMDPNMNMMGAATSPFMVGGGQQQFSPFSGLAGLVNQYGDIRSQQQAQPRANSFASQTPGDPRSANRMQQQLNPLELLSLNIRKRFGG